MKSIQWAQWEAAIKQCDRTIEADSDAERVQAAKDRKRKIQKQMHEYDGAKL